MKTAFWICLLIVCYTYVGYGLFLYVLVRLRRLFKGEREAPSVPAEELPSLTLIVAAWNEQEVMEQKIANTLSLEYPRDRLQLLFVTDGSTDATPEIVARYPQIRLLHSPERRGKIHAMHRAMQTVDADIVVFTDANTTLNQEALLRIARHYADPRTGAVAGEKRVHVDQVSDATAGEGFYWKYESTLKKWDSELYSVVGAAGELFSIRRELYQAVPADTILDDFMISLRVAEKGYRIVYEPEAYAMEYASASVQEELKRKIRIAAGGIQSVLRLKALLNPFRHPLLSFQYISHRVLRWTLTPFCMIAVFLLNISLVVAEGGENLYGILLAGQVFFYLAAFLGWALERRKLKVKLLFIPYYFCVMNYAVLAGIFRFFSGRQSALWEKAKRKEVHTQPRSD
jgi:biofilm PGA synthesis N-glycosyltransferase PgaC